MAGWPALRQGTPLPCCCLERCLQLDAGGCLQAAAISHQYLAAGWGSPSLQPTASFLPSSSPSPPLCLQVRTAPLQRLPEFPAADAAAGGGSDGGAGAAEAEDEFSLDEIMSVSVAFTVSLFVCLWAPWRAPCLAGLAA